MLRGKHLLLMLSAVFFCSLGPAFPSIPLAQEVKGNRNPRGILKIFDYYALPKSVALNYAEGLVELDKDNHFIPCLAESWKWIDERTIEFSLRRGVTFHNGEPFNSEAVRLNWEAYNKLKNPSFPGFSSIQNGTIFTTIDDFTVRFTFPEPDGMALMRVRWFLQFAPDFLSRYQFGENKWGYLPESGPWGTGPFKLVEGSNELFKPSDQIVLEAYEGYWDNRYPMVKTIIFDNTLINNREEAMRLSRETEGKADIITYIRPLDTLKIAESSFSKVVKSRDSSQLHMAINQRKENSKWRDIRLRKALNHALDREELMQYAAKGNAFNLGGHIPPGARGHNSTLSLYTYDPAKAKSLLAEAGYPDGFELTIITPEAHDLEVQVIKRMYERIGLKVNLEVLAFHEWARKIWTRSEKLVSEQKWDLSVCFNTDVFGHSGAGHLTRLFLDASDLRWIEYDPTYEKMWKDMAGTVNEKAQDEIMRQMEQYVYDRAYAVFIYSPLNLYAVNKEINFVPQKYLGLRLKETSVTDKHWSLRPKD